MYHYLAPFTSVYPRLDILIQSVLNVWKTQSEQAETKDNYTPTWSQQYSPASPVLSLMSALYSTDIYTGQPYSDIQVWSTKLAITIKLQPDPGITVNQILKEYI